MMKGGGGFLGSILSIASIFVPALQPIALAINTVSAIDSGNPLALASSAMGWGNYTNGFTNFSDPFTRDMGSLGDMFTPDPSYMSGNMSDIAAFDSATFGAGAGDITTSNLGGDWASNAGWGGFEGALATPFDQAASGIRQMGADEFLDSTKGFKDISGQIESGVSGAQGAASDALNFSKQAGIAAGSQDVAMNTLKDLYTVPGYNYDISALTPKLDINTIGGYSGANELLTSGPMSLENMQGFGSTGNAIGDLSLSQAGAPGVTDPSATAFSSANELGNNPNAFGKDSITDAFDSWGQSAQPSTTPSMDISGGTGGQTFGDFDPLQDQVGLAYGNAGTNWQTPDWGKATMGTLQDMFKGGKDSFGMKAAKGVGALLDYNQANKAADQMRSMYDRAIAGSDQFANERALASAKWMEGASNPDAMWNQYMQGSGGQALNQAAAKYAKAGRRNMLPQMTSQAKQQFMAEAYPSLMKLYNPTQFKGDQGAVNTAFAAPMADMTRNKYAPLTHGIQSVFGSPSYDLGALAKLFRA